VKPIADIRYYYIYMEWMTVELHGWQLVAVVPYIHHDHDQSQHAVHNMIMRYLHFEIQARAQVNHTYPRGDQTSRQLVPPVTVLRMLLLPLCQKY
jgi:hypothetical protein